MSRTGGVPSTRQTTAILRVRSLTRTVSLISDRGCSAG
jgi:hypothetical protein